MTTLLVVLGVLLVLGMLLTTPFYWLGAIFMQSPRATIGRALIAMLATVALGVPLIPAGYFLGKEMAELGGLILAILAAIGVSVVWFIASILAIRSIFQTTLVRAFVISVLPTLPNVMIGVLAFFPLKLFVMEVYVVPTNAMAPTIIGYHREAPCPRCRGTIILPARDPREKEQFQPLPDGICLSCRRVTENPAAPPAVHGPDRVLVNKLLTPERWDVIAFRHPPGPTQKYVMRLVALPGEKVYIKGTNVWINDAKLDVPAELAGLEYTTEMGFFPELRGIAENPVQLGENEYFVLGDFSKNSSDSRFWGPVPQENIEGVVCLRYWPAARWQVLKW
jgi:signal peptidase I